MKKVVRLRIVGSVLIILASLIGTLLFLLPTSTPPELPKTLIVSFPSHAISIGQIRRVLSNSGFQYYPAKEMFCGGPCKSYTNPEYDLIALSYDDGTLAVGIRFIKKSGVQEADQASLVSQTLRLIYPKEVTGWISDNLDVLNTEPRPILTTVVNRYYVHMETVFLENGSGISIVITSVNNLPGVPNSSPARLLIRK